jgi:hypothetical protein
MIMVSTDFTEGGIAPFTGTAISSGTVADVSTFGGAIRLSGAATTDDSGYQIQSKTQCFQSKVKSYLVFEAAILSSAAAVGWKAGFAITDTTLYAGVNDAILLEKTEGSSEVRLRVYDAGASTVNEPIGNFDSTSAYVGYKIEVDISDTATNKAKITVSVNGQVKFQSGWVTIPTEAMAASIAAQSSSATGTQYIDVDAIHAVQPREAV